MCHFMVLLGAFVTNVAQAQTVTADQPSYETGDVLVATYENISGAGVNTFIALARTDMSDDEYSWWHLIPFAIDGTIEFDHLPVGAHMELRIYKDGGLEIMARSPEFSVDYPSGITPSVTADRNNYAPGEDHLFTWTAAPGYYYDWLAVAIADTIAAEYVGYKYTEGDYDGVMTWSEMDHSAGGVDDLPPGDYEVRGYVNDEFDIWAYDEFAVALPDDWPSTVVADRNLYTPSESVSVCWTGAPGNPLDWVGIAKRALPSTELYSYTDVDGNPLWDYTDGLVDGCASFTTTKELGQYAARAFENDTYVAFANQDLFTVNFEPANPATPPQGSVSSDLTEYSTGEPIEATFDGLPGNTTDFIALAASGSSTSDPNEILWWEYTDGADAGSFTIYSLLEGGDFVLRAYAADAFTLLAESDPFTVVLDPDQLPKVYSIPVCIAPGTPELYIAYQNTIQGADAWVGIFDEGAPADAFSYVWSYVSGASEASAMFPVDTLAEGSYEIRLLNGRRSVAYSTPLTVDSACPTASISADQAWYTEGEPIVLSFSGLNAHPHEYVGLIFDGLDPTSGLYSESVSVYPDNSGTAVLTAAEGIYRAHAFLDPDGSSLASTGVLPVCPPGQVPDCNYACVDDDLIPPFACTGDTGAPPVPFGGTLLINEILTDPIAVDGDANCDGGADTSDDEFIELVNISGDLAVNLSLATISDSFGPRHVFSPGTVLGPGETMVVFGAGTPTFDGSLGHAWCAPLPAGVDVQVATTGLLGFNNNGDTVTVHDVDGNLLDTYTWSAEGNFDQSLVRKPELAFSGFVFHTTMPFTTARFSPGTRAAGGDFDDPAPDTSGPTLPVDGLLNEVLADPDLVLGDANCDGVVSTTQDEFVEIVNHTASTVDLSGTRLEDEFGPRHVFPQGTEVVAGGAIVVFGGGAPTFDGSNGSAWCGSLPGDVVTAVASSGSLGLSNSGDTVYFYTIEGVLIDSLTWAAEGNDNQSLNRTPEITEGAAVVKHLDMYGATTRQSPGRRAALGGLSDAPPDTSDPGPGDTGDSAPPPPPPVDPTWLQAVINEMLVDPDPTEGDANCDGIVSATDDEFVEIVNNGAVAMDLSLVVLSDGVLARHQFPPGTLIEPDGAIVVFGGGSPSIDGDPDETWCTALPANVQVVTASSGALGLSNAGDTVTLTLDLDVIDTASFGGEAANNQSLVRGTEGDTDAAFVDHETVPDSIGPQSPGRGADGIAFDGSSDVDLPPPPPPDPVLPTLVINEVLADPPAVNGDANCDGTNSTTQDEFVEIVNYGDTDQDLSSATLADTTSTRHTFAAGTILEPGETIVVFAGGAVSFDGSPALAWCNAWPSSVTGVIATTAQLGLNNTGDTVTLKAADGVTVIDTMTYGAEGGSDTSVNRIVELDPTSLFAKHNTLSAHAMSPGRLVDQSDISPDPWSHSITVDGFSSDWVVANEQFDTTGGGTANYVGWDTTALYIGTFNGDVNSGGNQHWFVAYLGDDLAGTTTGITHNTQQPVLPFQARYVFRWKADNSYNSLLTWNGSAWVETAFWFGTAGSELAERNDQSFMEMKIPFAALSSLGTDLNLHLSWLYEGSFFESTYSGSPFDSFVNGTYDPNFSTWLAFDLASPESPDVQSGP